MKWILLLWLIWLAYLAVESARTRRARKKLPHIIHVNGTRGKSTVSRLIAAGLRAGGISVFCKTTGTDPMVIDVDGREQPIHRRGPANIKEQIRILRQAAEQGAQVLVVECMAVRPELQQAAQSSILKADIGVIMLAVCRALEPQQVWLLGATQGYMVMGLRRWLPQVPIRKLKSCGEIDLECLDQDQVLFAIGNIAHQGRKLMDFVRERGEQIV